MTYEYNEEIRSIFASMDEHWRVNTIAIFQGKRPNYVFYHSWLEQSNYTIDDINRIIDDLCKDERFTKYVLWRHKKRWGNDLYWDFYVTYVLSTYDVLTPNGYKSWQCLLLGYLYEWYREENRSLYPEYEPRNPLEVYYSSKGLDLDLSSNYGLIDTANFDIKISNLPKLYDKKLDTHIFIKNIPIKLLCFLVDEQKKSSFKLSLRPDYNICGDGINDLQYICESLIRGEKQPIWIDKMPSLTWLCDDNTSSDRLIILHNQQTKEITFEEILLEPQIEDDYIITQVVHLIYTSEKEGLYIKHLDQEYVFYTTEEHNMKMIDLRQKGTAKKRYKTFKIDDARIEYRHDCTDNILYHTLDAYFENKDLLKEYFECMINQSKQLQ